MELFQTKRTSPYLRWRFLETWNFQSTIYYRGARQTTQGQESGDTYFGSGISKELLDEQATISLNIRDLLNTRQSDREIINPHSYTNSQYSWSSRSFRLNSGTILVQASNNFSIYIRTRFCN